MNLEIDLNTVIYKKKRLILPMRHIFHAEFLPGEEANYRH